MSMNNELFELNNDLPHWAALKRRFPESCAFVERIHAGQHVWKPRKILSIDVLIPDTPKYRKWKKQRDAIEAAKGTIDERFGKFIERLCSHGKSSK